MAESLIRAGVTSAAGLWSALTAISAPCVASHVPVFSPNNIRHQKVLSPGSPGNLEQREKFVGTLALEPSRAFNQEFSFPWN